MISEFLKLDFGQDRKSMLTVMIKDSSLSLLNFTEPISPIM